MAGCTTVASMEKRDLRGGEQAAYKASYEETYRAAIQACQDLDLSIAKEDFKNRFIIARSMGRTNYFFINYGELVGIYFREINPTKTDVTIVNKRRYKPGFLYYEDWTDDLHAGIHGHIA